MDELDIGRAHLHGYGMGGSIVTQLLDRHPDRILTASYGGSGIREVEADPIDLAKVTAPVLAINGALDRPDDKTSRMRRELSDFWSFVLPDRDQLTTLGPVYARILASFVTLYDPGTPQPSHGYFVASDGVKLHYWGMGEGTPVVLLHGFTGSADLWLMNGVAAALRGHHRVLALDSRGHGRSEKPHDPARYGVQMAEDVIELLDHLGIERAHIHGFSLGGWILSRLLATHQDRVLTGTYCGYGAREVDAELDAMVPPDREGTATRDSETRQQPGDPLDLEARAMLSASTPRDDEAFAAARAHAWKPGERLEGEIFPSRLPLDLTKVRVPILALMGQLDSPNRKTQRLWRELHEFTLVRLPGRAHVSAVAPGYIAPQYIPATVRFIAANDTVGIAPATEP